MLLIAATAPVAALAAVAILLAAALLPQALPERAASETVEDEPAA